MPRLQNHWWRTRMPDFICQIQSMTALARGTPQLRDRRDVRNGGVSHRDAVEDRPELDGMAAAHSSGPARSWMRVSTRGLRGQARSVVEALVTAATGDIPPFACGAICLCPGILGVFL
jgi:hypothetical protein